VSGFGRLKTGRLGWFVAAVVSFILVGSVLAATPAAARTSTTAASAATFTYDEVAISHGEAQQVVGARTRSDQRAGVREQFASALLGSQAASTTPSSLRNATKPGTDLIPRQGSVTVLGKAKQTELTYADELAGRGYDVTVRGTSAQGGDFIVNGLEWELKTLNSGSQTAVIRNIKEGIAQGNGRVIVDGRAAGLTHGDALRALDRLRGSGALSNATEIVIETRSGRIGWP
jgi:hypothetical protein